MKIFGKIFAAVMCGAVLCGCSKSDSTSKYVDLDSVGESDSSASLNVSVEDFEYDDKPINVMNCNFTVDSNYVYIFSTPNRKISLADGEVQSICEITGCAHTEDTQGCVNYQDIGCPVATTNGIYYVDGENLMLLSDGTEEVVATNDYYTDYEK